MRLHAWRTVRRDIEFDPETGSAQVIRLAAPRPEGSIPAGFAAFERSALGRQQVFALYRSGDELFFNAGRQRWRLGSPDLEFAHRHLLPFVSRFRVLESGRTTFSIVYLHIGRLFLALLDWTYDKIDEDQDFFLGFVAEYAQSADWQKHIGLRWSSATSHLSAS